MGKNLSVPPIYVGNSNRVAFPFSFGPSVSSLDGNTVSLVDTVNVTQPANTSNFPAMLTTASAISLSAVVNQYYKQFTMGTNFGVAGSVANITSYALAGAQAFTFRLEGRPETFSPYHTAQDASIWITLSAETVQRTVVNTTGLLQNNWAAAIRAGSVTCQVIETNEFTVINAFDGSGNPDNAAHRITSSAMHDGTYTVKVTDNSSGFWYTTQVVCGFGGSSNFYNRMPGKQQLNGGAWTTNTNQYP